MTNIKKNYTDYSELVKVLDKYPTPTDLVYKHKYTHNELDDINQGKYSDNRYTKIKLYNADGTNLIFLNSDYIKNKLIDSESLIDDANIDSLLDIDDEELINGFIFSEIESSLAIEGVRSTRAKIEKISKTDYDKLKNDNEIIVKNMLEAYSYMKTTTISKESILTLYNIISNNCLDKSEILLKGNYYRHDVVDIIGSNERVIDTGVDHTKLDSLMNQLISYIHNKKSPDDHILAPHIIHFYMVYLHPYFDYNGRMARALSFWYSMQYSPLFSLLFVSEAINNQKNKKRYYNAISLSRKTNNDITYFIEYMADIILEYSIVYINYYNIIESLQGKGEVISRATQTTIKNVLVMYSIKDEYFDWKKYKTNTPDNFSKVQYLKYLNALLELKILTVKKQKKVNLYKVNSKKWNIISLK